MTRNIFVTGFAAAILDFRVGLELRKMYHSVVQSYLGKVTKAFPLTPSGKIDRSKLPPPRQRREAQAVHVSPRSELERILARIWRETLTVEQVGIDDKFFDIGGNSIALVRIQNLINERVHRDIPIVVLFRYPTVRALASYIAGEHRSDDVDLSTKRGETRKSFLMQRNISGLRSNTRGIRGTQPS